MVQRLASLKHSKLHVSTHVFMTDSRFLMVDLTGSIIAKQVLRDNQRMAKVPSVLWLTHHAVAPLVQCLATQSRRVTHRQLIPPTSYQPITGLGAIKREAF
jgi:hypothetical protein